MLESCFRFRSIAEAKFDPDASVSNDWLSEVLPLPFCLGSGLDVVLGLVEVEEPDGLLTVGFLGMKKGCGVVDVSRLCLTLGLIPKPNLSAASLSCSPACCEFLEVRFLGSVC